MHRHSCFPLLLSTSLLCAACGDSAPSRDAGTSGSPASSGGTSSVASTDSSTTTGSSVATATSMGGATNDTSATITTSSTDATTTTTANPTTMGSVGGATTTSTAETTSSGGAAATTTGDVTTTGGANVGPCDGVDMFCDDFEMAPLGGLPSGGQWLGIDENACPSGNFDLEVSDEQVYSGTQSLKITNASWAQCRLPANFGDADEFWLRANLYWSSNVDLTNKEAIAIDLTPSSGTTSDDPAVRFGSRTKEPCTMNGGAQITIIGLGSGESTGCDGNHPLPQDTWYCFEAHVTQNDTTLEAQTFINGEALTYESSGKEPSSSISTEGISGKVNHVRLGMFSTDSSLTGNVYIDDIAISTSRVGCN